MHGYFKIIYAISSLQTVVEFSNITCTCHYIEGRELVGLLLAAGADPSAQDSQNGRTALHTAAMTNDVDLIKVSESAF